jgi:putative oxidoreductase
MFRKLLSTPEDWGLTIARLALGVVMFPHGLQKTLGWFGGPGFHAMMAGFTRGGIPPVLAFLAICAESMGGLGLILGLLSRVAAFGVLCVMVVAVFRVNLAFGLFINWGGNQKGEGIEFHVLAIAIAIVILMRGAGALSLDRALSRK